MMASAIVMVRHLSSSLIFIRLNARRLNTARRFSSPRALPLGLPLRPFRKRVAFGGFPYPTSEGSSDDFSKLLFFMKYSFSSPLVSGQAEIALECFVLFGGHPLMFVKDGRDGRWIAGSL